ncbi:Crp/Fnr family transcriptional regulator [Roseivirga misakiensis]|uniref:Crp/Fnr family transcriptional regulator n=1 Tax=Roseivirga misakiensis TaxID=1563681 RepID=A0A1E5SKU3_9BACT|nr:Crp/Fnr family transcriptional regulator [Roseivirga misakiensis]OEJ99742.1 Crp/Fnr family transcriptional regulator [Roseivirga misakiensis]
MSKKLINVKKGQFLQRKGDLNTKVYVVQKGLLRSYAIDEKGKEHIFMFAPEGWIIADNLPSDLPADLFIDAIEDSEVIVKEKDISEEKDSEKFIKRLTVLQKRVIMLMSASAITRYDHFIKTYPKITKRVPQRMIASYLGITPEALSKSKKNHFKGN